MAVEVVHMLKHRKAKPQPQQDNDRFLIDMWRQENEARRVEGLPPVPYEVWLQWYRWRQKQDQQGGAP